MSDLEKKAEVFDVNLKALLSIYNRGQFEFLIAEAADSRLLTEAKVDQRISSKLPPPPSECRWIDIKDASRKLRDLAEDISGAFSTLKDYAQQKLYKEKSDRLWPQLGGEENLLKGILRARVLHYEIHDYYLSIGEEDSSFFIGVANRMAAKGGSRCIGGLLSKMFGLKGTSERDGLYKASAKEICLFALFGVQSLIRDHEFDEGLKVLDAVEAFIRRDLPQVSDGPSYGLQGLSQYLRARLYFGLGRLGEARQAAVDSTRNYALTTEQQENKMLRGELRQEDFDERRLLSIRRSALTTSIGSAHISILVGRIEEALKLLAVSQAVLTLDCGEVHARYVDLLWAEGVRALHSDKPSELIAAGKVLYRARKTFERLVPDSHYYGRTSVELALVYFYLARHCERAPSADERLKRKCRNLYERAKRYASEAIDLATETVGGRQRNPRLAADGYDVRSRVRAFSPESDFEGAVRDAEEAERCAGQMTQVRCEALIAGGAALVRKAEHMRRRGKEAEMMEAKARAEAKLKEAYELNANNNARIRAVALLRLAQAGFLTPVTYPDARFFLGEYRDSAEKVEYAFVKELEKEVEATERAVGKFFYANTSETWNATVLRERLEAYLVDEFVNELAEVIGGNLRLDNMRDVRAVKKSNINVVTPRQRGPKPTVISFLANNLEKNIDLHRNKAWDFARKKEKEFITKCRMVQDRVGRDS